MKINNYNYKFIGDPTNKNRLPPSKKKRQKDEYEPLNLDPKFF